MNKIVLFGDSLFNGYRDGVDTSLVTESIQKAVGSSFSIKNLSLSGATTDDGIKRLRLIDPKAILVVLELGTNDSSAMWGISRERYAQNLNKMVSYIGQKRLIIVGPSYENFNNNDIRQSYSEESLDLFNDVAQKCAAAHQISFVNLIAHFRKIKDLSSYYQDDGQHFADKGNELFISLIVNAIKQKLAS